MKTTKELGKKDYVIFYILAIIEMLINIPFYIIKLLIFPFYYIYYKLLNRKAVFYLSEIPKIDKFMKKVLRDYEYKKRNMMNEMNTISDENIRVPKCEEE